MTAIFNIPIYFLTIGTLVSIALILVTDLVFVAIPRGRKDITQNSSFYLYFAREKNVLVMSVPFCISNEHISAQIYDDKTLPAHPSKLVILYIAFAESHNHSMK